MSSSEDKWRRMNGITVLLPHGYEGQGAEHSSGRMERFLTLCAEDNMQITNCTTPANFFHLLRRQLHRPFRKPLIVFTPKSLLRHPKCVSKISEFTTGGFSEVIDDNQQDVKKVNKIAFCTGKIYYDLLERKEKDQAEDVAIVRIEQLYPFPQLQVDEIVNKYQNAEEYLWVQEEPENMGAWSYLLRTFTSIQLKNISRSESASPATGSHQQHEKEQHALLDRVFASNLVAN
jgi:2-oxoglutarate dehydrogenase E1 component